MLEWLFDRRRAPAASPQATPKEDDLGSALVILTLADGSTHERSFMGHVQHIGEAYLPWGAADLVDRWLGQAQIGSLFKVKSGLYVPIASIKSVKVSYKSHMVKVNG